MNPKDTPAPGPGSPRRPAHTPRAARGKPAKQPRTGARKPARVKTPSRTAKKSAESWIAAAEAEPNDEQAEAIYAEALTEWPRNVRLLCDAAFHLQADCDDRAGAESLYRRAFALQPRSQFVIESLTDILCKKRGGWREAAEILLASLRRHPRDRFALTRLALILTDHPRDYDAAERLYRRCVRIAPREPFPLRNLAGFLLRVRRDADAAERLHRRILRCKTARALDIVNYAHFLRDTRRDCDAAERHYRAALAHSPKCPPVRAALAMFLIIHRGRFEEGETLLIERRSRDAQAVSEFAWDEEFFGGLPATRGEWIEQIGYGALFARSNAATAEYYATLKRMRPEFFPEDR